MCGLYFPKDDNVLVGLDRADDAGVYRISNELALIQTIDFFTPIVDDPYWFGQIAAANALSDIYAMGGTPKTALNLVGFPVDKMDISVLRDIIQGGIDKTHEAGVVLLGGHSVEDEELKYGLSVTGFVHPDRVLTKSALVPGDHLILTKPLGTGIINTAVKANLAGPETVESATMLMAALNRYAAETMIKFNIHACTDVTGFGLIGHLAEMLQGSGCSAVIDVGRVPIIPEALDFAAMGLIPAGAYRNREFRSGQVISEGHLDRSREDILYDPQTSGGLLICVDNRDARPLLKALHSAGITDAAVICEISDDPSERIFLR